MITLRGRVLLLCSLAQEELTFKNGFVLIWTWKKFTVWAFILRQLQLLNNHLRGWDASKNLLSLFLYQTWLNCSNYRLVLIFSNGCYVKGIQYHSFGKRLLASKCFSLEWSQVVWKEKWKVGKLSETFSVDTLSRKKSSWICLEVSSAEARSR